MQKTIWKGYERYDFTVGGRDSIVIKPELNSGEMPWIWRAEFFDAFSAADMSMLEKGWHLAYHRVSDMYGCPDAIEMMRDFQNTVEEKFGLAEKAVIFGFSRGGLYAFNYAAEHPEKVSLLYLDAPVLDIKSWPGGLGEGEGATGELKECLKWYSLNDDTILNFKGNPLDKIEKVAKASIPIIIVAGDADKVVPLKENSMILEKKYRELGGCIKVIIKHGVGHHPHSLEDTKPITDFILRYSKGCK